MKEVLVEPPVVDFCVLSAVSVNKFYGVKKIYGTEKGFVRSKQYNVPCYVIYSDKAFTEGNFYNGIESHTLLGCIALALKMQFQVFEFDTLRELMLWVTDPEPATE